MRTNKGRLHHRYRIDRAAQYGVKCWRIPIMKGPGARRLNREEEGWENKDHFSLIFSVRIGYFKMFVLLV